jgi:hypothetical protein
LEVSGLIHAPTVLLPENEPPISIGKEAGCASEPVWTIWRRANFLPYGDSNFDPSAVSPQPATILTALSRLLFESIKLKTSLVYVGLKLVLSY